MNERVHVLIFFILGAASLILPNFISTEWVLSLSIFIISLCICRCSCLRNISFILPYAAITIIPYSLSIIFPPFVSAEPGLSFSLIIFAAAILLSTKPGISEGILFGYLLSAVFILFSFAGYPLIEESSFWRDQGRYSGLMKDPNALSVSAFLMLGFLNYQRNKSFNIFVIALSLILGLFSGARLYILGVGLFFLFYLLRTFRLKTVITSLSLLCFIVFTLFYFTPTDKFPVGIQRVYDTITFNNVESTILNRISFNEVSIRMFAMDPIFGIGSGNYKRELLPFSYSLLGTWSDNANNFYLQLLTEQGIFGFFIFCLCFLRIRRNNVFNLDPSLTVLGIFGVLLFFGPHIEFLEVSFISGILFQKCFTGIQHTKSTMFFSGFSAMCLSVITLFSTRGVYPYEYDQGFFRWTKDKAVILIDCKNPLLLSSGREHGIDVIIWSADFHIQIPVSSNPKKVDIPCSGKSGIVTLSTENTFTPNSDNRILGIKISGDKS